MFVVGFGLYGLYKASNFLIGPKIFIESPEEGKAVSNSYLEIKGTVKNVSTLSLNGQQIFTDENGFFKENLLLARGYNIIEIAATDKFGHQTKIQREVILR